MFDEWDLMAKELNSIYEEAYGELKLKTGGTVNLPEECPYTLEQLLELNWFPTERYGFY